MVEVFGDGDAFSIRHHGRKKRIVQLLRAASFAANRFHELFRFAVDDLDVVLITVADSHKSTPQEQCHVLQHVPHTKRFVKSIGAEFSNRKHENTN